MLKFDNLTLESMRALGQRVLVALMGLGAVATLLLGLILGTGYAVPGTLVALAAMALPTWHLIKGRADAGARLTLGLAAPLIPAAMITALSGHGWQTDAHMAFFAVIAALVILCDAWAIFAAAALTAVHHLVLSFIAPQLVFGAEGSIARVLFHAVLVVVETGVLIWTARALVALLDTAEASLAEAKSASAIIHEQGLARSAVLRDVQQALKRLAEGDLTVRLDRPFSAEFESLRTDFNRTAEELSGTMAGIVEAVAAINASTSDISSAASDLSRRTEVQASTIGETSAATADSSGAAEAVASRAQESEKLFGQALAEAEQGCAIVEEARRAMQEISTSSSAVTSIVSLIDGIAFQTTLLALNAGVEAARSGEAGRGFAVVATEIRALAEKASQSAAEISQLISRSTQQVEKGVGLVSRTGESVDGMIQRLASFRALVGEIAHATEGQSRALGTVNRSIAEISQSTQSNAAMAEQSQAATRSLSEQARLLAEMTRRFRFAEWNAQGNCQAA